MEQQRFLETERLKIRIDTVEDYVHHWSTLSDEELMVHFGFNSIERLANQKEKVKGGLTTYRNKVLFFQLIQKETNTIIGSFAFHNWYPAYARAEMGAEIYEESNKYNGYMSEALKAILAYGFLQLGLNRIEAIIDPSNEPSIRVAKKMGFVQEALLKEHYCYDGATIDSLILALLRNDYDALNKDSN